MNAFDPGGMAMVNLVQSVFIILFYVILLGLISWAYFKIKNPGYIIIGIWGVFKILQSIIMIILRFIGMRSWSFESFIIMYRVNFFVDIIISLVLFGGIAFVIFKSEQKYR